MATACSRCASRGGLPASRPAGDRHEDLYCVQSQKRYVFIFVLVMLVTVRYSWGKKNLPSLPLQPKKQRHEQIMQINFILRLTNTTGSLPGGFALRLAGTSFQAQ